MFEKFLQDIGLNEKEAKVYLELLQTDGASVIDIAKKTKINRTTVYTVLESLAKKGLVSETTVGKKTQYQSEPPERLETFVERTRIQLEEKSKILKEVIPQIRTFQKSPGERPLVKIYDGKEGVVSLLNNDVFNDSTGGKNGEPMYLIYSHGKLHKFMTEKEREKIRQLRLKKDIKARSIFTTEGEGRPTTPNTERIEVDKEKYPIEADVAIYQDKVRISIIGKKFFGIFIKSPDIANTFKSLFNLAWDNKKGPGLSDENIIR